MKFTRIVFFSVVGAMLLTWMSGCMSVVRSGFGNVVEQQHREVEEITSIGNKCFEVKIEKKFYFKDRPDFYWLVNYKDSGQYKDISHITGRWTEKQLISGRKYLFEVNKFGGVVRIIEKNGEALQCK